MVNETWTNATVKITPQPSAEFGHDHRAIFAQENFLVLTQRAAAPPAIGCAG